MTRDEILAEIRETAATNGGRPLGQRRFSEVTGISAWAWGKYWAKWSDAQRDAGFSPNSLNAALDGDFIMARYLALARELGKVPTRGELRLMRQRDPEFPDMRTFTRRGGSKGGLVASALEYCRAKEEFADLVPLFAAASEEIPPPETLADAPMTVGFVYLARARKGEFKIGRTNLVGRRLGEVGATLPVELELVHEVKTDDPVGVEGYWHRRFAERRLRGEWFRLSAADVRAFKRWRRIF